MHHEILGEIPNVVRVALLQGWLLSVARELLVESVFEILDASAVDFPENKFTVQRISLSSSASNYLVKINISSNLL